MPFNTRILFMPVVLRVACGWLVPRSGHCALIGRGAQ
jgi:hypothetical protein